MKIIFEDIKRETLTAEGNIIQLTKEKIDGLQFYVLMKDDNTELYFPTRQYKLYRVEQ